MSDHSSASGSSGSDRHSEEEKKKERKYSEGIFSLSSNAIIPFRVWISIPPAVSIQGSLSLDTRVNKMTSFTFTPNEDPGDKQIWDSRGRGVLVDGFLRCNYSHEVTLLETKKAGLTLGYVGSMGIAGSGGEIDRTQGHFYKEEETCPVGPIPAYTTADQIADLCKPCVAGIAKVFEKDVQARAQSLRWLVNTPLCKVDKDCEESNHPGIGGDTWIKGRCLLVRDENGSHITECRSRSKIGGPCPGKGASSMFTYPCDKGLKCVKTHDGKGFFNWSGRYDYSVYQCQDPAHPEWKITPRGYYSDEE